MEANNPNKGNIQYSSYLCDLIFGDFFVRLQLDMVSMLDNHTSLVVAEGRQCEDTPK